VKAIAKSTTARKLRNVARAYRLIRAVVPANKREAAVSSDILLLLRFRRAELTKVVTRILGVLSYALEVALAEWCGVPIPPRSMPFDRSYRICQTRLCVRPEADHAPQAARRAEQREARRARAQALVQ
jgi:hypothetical protein